MDKNPNIQASFFDSNFAQFCLQSLTPLINFPLILEDKELIKTNNSPCNCSKSNCLKLYCECFGKGKYCIDCNCVNCFNTPSNESLRNKAVANIVRRNADAFLENKNTAGCICKKTGCLKKYCKCHMAGQKCGPKCRCVNCKNIE